jgi:hypothetical protein
MGCGCNRDRDDVLGIFDRDRDRDRDRRRDFTFDAKISIDRDDFCRAVNRCIEDLVAGAREDRRDDRRDRRHCCWNWIF